MVNNKILEIFNKRYHKQILVTLAAQIITLCHGISTGWLSPTLLILQSPQTPLDFTVTENDVSWIGSIFGIGTFCSNILFGLIINGFGRKLNICLLSLPHMLFWVLIYFAQSVEYLYVARFCAGLTSGGLNVVGPVFVSEISDKEIRGSLISLAMMIFSIGILIGYTLPSYLNYHLIPCIVIFVSIFFITAMIFFPDTPTSLLQRERLEKAERSFNFYRNVDTKEDVNGLQLSHVKREFEELKASKLQGGVATPIALHDFTNRAALKKFALAIVVLIQYQFSSSYALLHYMSHIFAASGSTMDSNKCTIIAGVVQIVFTFSAAALVDYLGRRILMLISVFGMALSMFVLGAFVQFTNEATKAEYNWFALLAISFITATSAIGILSLSFGIIVEILPAKIRPQAQSVTMIFGSVMIFITLKMYPYFLFNLGISITMYTCAGSCVVTGTCLLLFLPETKGKSMAVD